MVNAFYYNGNYYVNRGENDRLKGYLLSGITAGLAYKSLPLFGLPFEKQLEKERSNNHVYRQKLDKAFEISGLNKLGVSIKPAQYDKKVSDYSLGKNACYEPITGHIKINTDNMSISAFHEMGHALNDLTRKSTKILVKCRYPGYLTAGLMEYFAIFSRTKPKEAQKTISDRIENNCGKIAFAAMLPIVAEEAIASIRGINLAKKTGIKEPFIKSMKNLYSKALLTYGARAVIGGIAVFLTRKIMDYYTYPQKVDSEFYELFG